MVVDLVEEEEPLRAPEDIWKICWLSLIAFRGLGGHLSSRVGELKAAKWWTAAIFYKWQRPLPPPSIGFPQVDY
ncbi:hypothetical protein GOP47_0009415 [Adiantum capillus-veneris]|uniref:Uncharacterized protein n=1 Tax=Adiantum capillus-veneris TaxID=13818 RepID=A0A9D4ZH70_ADICA|nr:hypothetical protein GOP47_0009415 [Adiantum capillus-veneris]